MNTYKEQYKIDRQIKLSESALFATLLFGVNSLADTLTPSAQAIERYADLIHKIATIMATGGIMLAGAFILMGLFYEKRSKYENLK
jgi:hypothetical protein